MPEAPHRVHERARMAPGVAASVRLRPTMGAEPTDVLSEAVLDLAAHGLTHPMLPGWLRTPNASFGGRRPADVHAEQPELVFDLAALAARHDFRRGGPR